MLYRTVHLKQLLSAVAVPLLVGLAALILSSEGGKMEGHLMPPLFPSTWMVITVSALLCIMAGLASYLVMARSNGTRRALRLFYFMLLFTLLWPVIFFLFKMYVLAVFVLFVLWVMALLTTIQFFGIDPPAGLLLFPLLVWISYGVYINVAVAVLN